MEKTNLRVVAVSALLGLVLATVVPRFEELWVRTSFADEYPDTWCFSDPDPCPTCPEGTPRAGQSECKTNIYPYQWGSCDAWYPANCVQFDNSCGPDLSCTNPPTLTGGNICNVGVYHTCSS